jgi:hypothetical protein
MRLTASKLGLAQLCAFPFRPDIEVPQDPPGDAARLGTAWHDVVATTIIMPMQATGPAQLIDRALRDAGLDPEAWRDRLQAMRPIEIAKDLAREHITTRAEVAYAWHADSGDVEELGISLNRGYPDTVGICGTADFVYTEQTPDGFVLVIGDWKTGNPDNVEPAKDNAQLRFLAGCASRLVDVDLVRVELRFISPEGEVTIDAWSYSPLELLEAQMLLGVLWEMRTIAEPDPGPHCTAKYCPLRMSCPATTQAVQEAVPEAAPRPEGYGIVLAGPDAIKGTEHAEYVLHRWQALKAFGEHIEKILKAYADKHGPIPAGEGKIWGPLDIVKREVSCTADHSQELVELLEGHLPEAEALGLVKAQVSLTALAEASKRCAPPRKGAALERTIVDALRGAGMVTETQSTQYRVLNAKKDQVAA